MSVRIGSFSVDKLPDTCPRCGRGIHPLYCYEYRADPLREHVDFLQVVFRCPVNECQRLFVAKYINNNYHKSNEFYLNEVYLLDLVRPTTFPESIVARSEMFIKIFNQAKVADENGLDLITGPGYRKALEFLVKDYLIYNNPERGEDIKKMKLSAALGLIDDKQIEECASRATWLGNDETHYVRKWEDRDLEDLKNLIGMVVSWIDLKERSAEYLEAMPSKPPEGSS